MHEGHAADEPGATAKWFATRVCERSSGIRRFTGHRLCLWTRAQPQGQAGGAGPPVAAARAARGAPRLPLRAATVHMFRNCRDAHYDLLCLRDRSPLYVDMPWSFWQSAIRDVVPAPPAARASCADRRMCKPETTRAAHTFALARMEPCA